MTIIRQPVQPLPRMKQNALKWPSVFDETYPEAGASGATLAGFAESVGEPLRAAEITTINRRQQNPFPASDSLHAAYRPFDPERWILPWGPLPSLYLDFLKWSNGGEFRTGQRWFQFFPALDALRSVRSMLLGYNVPQYMPGALPIAFNGGGTFYLFDMRESAIGDEYPVVCAHSGNLGWRADQSVRVADSFLNACRGTVDIDDLR